MPALNRHSNKPAAPPQRSFDSERDRIPTTGLSLSPEERALLRDPAWMDEDEADDLMSMRREKENAGKTIPLRQYMAEHGIEIPHHPSSDDKPACREMGSRATSQLGDLSAPQPTTRQYRERRSIPLSFEGCGIRRLTQDLGLLGSKPAAKTNPQILRPLDSADPGGQFWAEQAGSRSLIRKPSNRSEPSVNGSGRELPGR